MWPPRCALWLLPTAFVSALGGREPWRPRQLHLLQAPSPSSVLPLPPRDVVGDGASAARTSRAAVLKEARVAPNATIRYREPGICETTEGVRSFSGYVDLDDGNAGGRSSTFFWFFEARQQPETAPVTLWLNGGPGSDSLVGLFTEIGPCSVAPDLNTTLNPFSWSEASHLLFLSQPVGVGFSHGQQPPGSEGGGSPRDGCRQVPVNSSAIDTTALAAEAAWHVVQAFLAKLPEMSGKVKSRNFSLWTESYGGHYGPAFLAHFHRQNELASGGKIPATQLNLTSLGIINGIIDASLQFPFYPKFAMNNTYGIKAVPDDVYTYMKFASDMLNGCRDQVYRCKLSLRQSRRSINSMAVCSAASNICRDNVEGPYYLYSGRSMYDIRRAQDDPPFPDFFVKYLNLPLVQEALGVDLVVQYEESNIDVYTSFQHSGDYVYPDYLEDLQYLLDNGVRIVLVHGDADYIGNWFGGEAVSLALSSRHAPIFRATPYKPFLVNGIDQGVVREYGNLAFVVVSGAGHFVPASHPDVALELFRRVTAGLDASEGVAPFGSTTTVIPFPPDAPVVTTTSTTATATATAAATAT